MNEKLPYIIRLKPYISETIWGGRKLIDKFGIETDKANAAEAWVLSGHPSGESVAVDCSLGGKTVSEMFNEYGEKFVGKNNKVQSRFPVLIKLIDAMDNLSVQVHPTDEYCKKTGRGESKTECWYIVDCEEGAGIYLGFKNEIDGNTFREAIKTNTLTDYLEFIPVKKGDFFFIESGTIHAIGKGVLLAEVQESSNTTYRVYDYGRIGKDGKPRELHVDDAIGVTKLVPYSQPACVKYSGSVADGKNELADCPLFKASVLQVNGEYTVSQSDNSFISLLALEGEGEIIAGDEKYHIGKGDSFYLPAQNQNCVIKGSNLTLIETEI